MPKSIVTGGAGFIGSHMADRLVREGHDVCVVDNLVTGKRSNVPAEAEFVKADVCWDHDMNKLFKEFEPDYVFHFAAQIDVRASVTDPLGDCEVNTVATINLLEAARSVDVKRFLFASSGGAVYGGANPPYTEKSPCLPKSPTACRSWQPKAIWTSTDASTTSQRPVSGSRTSTDHARTVPVRLG